MTEIQTWYEDDCIPYQFNGWKVKLYNFCKLILKQKLLICCSHDELLAQQGVYYNMWNQQLTDTRDVATVETEEKDDLPAEDSTPAPPKGCPAHH